MMNKSPLVALLLSALALAGCGNDQQSADAQLSLNAGAQTGSFLLNLGRNGQTTEMSPTAAATLRQALETRGQPIYAVAIKDLGYSNLMAPYGQNGPVQTWASTS